MKPLFLALALVLATSLPAWAVEPLVADLSKHLVAITTGFAGTDVLLFGAVDGEGEVVVVVRGPPKAEIVRRKDRRVGIWINSGSATVESAPSFYRVASTRPLAEIAADSVLDRHQIGLNHLDLTVESQDSGATPVIYRDALVRLKQKKGLYGDTVQQIGFMSHRLFRTEIHFPANVPVGTYLVEVYLIQGGEVISAQTTPLVISKIGVGADVFDFAHQQAAAYGLIAIILAAAAGWLAAAAFKK
ncbi:TIGR02186 family protein [Magnetospirillum sulfuroxidans]|uniref:TIGR02186 family protein n=1 Tax=Magnetospirillum sulfuroxidans TaxID=611300 RepID=A0ABS5IEB5_9PROT|nr:TIGR02186 family protein [Magnetospirillum sulfuroxidans]MBR9972616.1 TIGR02186 family protein [Magnetospirillum sulfuroxidans]